jgi:hypothetical protein
MVGIFGIFGNFGHGSAVAAVVAGAQPKDWPADAESHVVEIQREAADEKEGQLIAAAEAVAPVPEAVRAAMGEGAGEVEEGQWWMGESLNVRLPFALTGEAVAYYAGLVEGFRELELKRFTKPGSHFGYRASVRATGLLELDGKTFVDVYVVTMTMKFNQSFVTTTTEAMDFEKERVVVLDQDGKVLHVSGDGPTEAMVLAI